jgi:hypothetical protein
MVVQSRLSQALLLFLSVACILALGIISFIYLGDSGQFPPDEAKRYSEIVLYLSILFCILLTASYVFVFLRNRNILRELDKIVKMSLYNNFSPVDSLKKLSTIGEKIGQIYRNLSEISEKRALKISSLSALNAFLLDNLTVPVFITDIRGWIISFSRPIRERYAESDAGHDAPHTAEQGGLFGSMLQTVFPGLNFPEVMELLKDNYTSSDVQIDKQELHFFPIRNRDKEIAYVVCVPGRVSAFPGREPSVQKEKSIKQDSSKRGVFKRLLRKKSGSAGL